MDIDDVDWEDGLLIGSFFDFIADQDEADDKHRRKKRPDDPSFEQEEQNFTEDEWP